MRIDALNKVSQLYQTGNNKKISKNGEVRKNSDSLEISQAGKQYQIAKQAVTAAPDIREDLVSSIRERMNNGTYEVSDEAFADKLLNGYFG